MFSYCKNASSAYNIFSYCKNASSAYNIFSARRSFLSRKDLIVAMLGSSIFISGTLVSG